jgi:hypothetical protein
MEMLFVKLVAVRYFLLQCILTLQYDTAEIMYLEMTSVFHGSLRKNPVLGV